MLPTSGSRASATPLWHYDDSGIELICKSFLSGSVAQRILMFSEDGKQLYAFGDAAAKMSGAKALAGDLELDGKRIGRVEFFLKKPKYSEYAKFYFFTTTSAIALICISSTIAIWWLLRVYVNRPFGQLDTWMSKTEKGNYTDGIISFPQMEVQAVVKQFSEMVDGIKRREQDFRDSERRQV